MSYRPTYEEVTRELYHTAWVVLAMEGLKEKKLVRGGPSVTDKQGLEAIRTVGEEKGFAQPTEDEIASIMEELQQ